MKIKVKLFATLRTGRGKIVEMDVSSEETVNDVINKLNIRVEEIAILLINGRNEDFDKTFNENDEISIFPPVGGG